MAAQGTVRSWGNAERTATVLRGEDLGRLSKQATLARGLGRSYGDSSLPALAGAAVLETPLGDRILSFDRVSGRIRAEAGLSLFELNRLYLRRGYFSPVSPGTQFVTLGGMVASDVHGKMSHAVGCFGSHHVLGISIRVPDGRLINCGPEQEPELFWATVGGMGLTGHITEVEFELEKLPTPWIYGKSQRIDNIDHFIESLTRGSQEWPHGVGWIDCLSTGKNMGRGILELGRWATPSETNGRLLPCTRRVSVPFNLPSVSLNSASVRAFNFLYYWRHWRRQRVGLRHPDAFFYPLDAILHWNRIYGSRGFTQYQCVLPHSAGAHACREFLERLTKLGGASFLCVIKDCGEQGRGLLSFPLPGISIALDIPIRTNTQRLVDELNEVVIGLGGRIYLSKDTFTRPEHFRQMEGERLERFVEVKRRWDPNNKIRSAQGDRLFGLS